MRLEMTRIAQRRWKPMIKELTERLYVPLNFETGRVSLPREVQLSFNRQGKSNLVITVPRNTEVYFFPKDQFKTWSQPVACWAS